MRLLTSSSWLCSPTQRGCPGTRTIASTFLGLVPSPADAGAARRIPGGTLSAHCRQWRSTTARWSATPHSRLVAKMSYTNIGFALAPREFTLSTLRDIYGAALGYQVDRHQPPAGAGTPKRHHAAPVPSPEAGAAAAVRRRSTDSPTPSTALPTSSPHWDHPGESTGFLMHS